MSQNYPSFIAAVGSVVGATGAALWSAGCVSAGGTGGGTPGIYAITLDRGCDATQCAVIATVRGATLATLEVVQTSDTVKTVTARDVAGVVQDTDFDFMVVKAPLS